MEQSETPLTLHLYRKDEVLGALRWALINRNISESIYWGIELFDSDMEDSALELLEFVWITEIGFACVSLLTHILSIYKKGELDRDIWISLLYSITQIKARDSTLLYLLIRGANESNLWSPRFHHSRTYMTIHDALEDTLSRKKLLESWFISRALDSNEQWLILDKLIKRYPQREEFILTIRESDLSDLTQRLIAIVLLCLKDSLQETPFVLRELPSETRVSIDEWDKEGSLRKRRVYKIRQEALLYLTQRSQDSELISSESDIQDELLESLLNSPYWSDILNGYMKEGCWTSDSYKEMFYETYFDDIPDEWSREDREKSHGRGLARTPEIGLSRFIDSLFQRSKPVQIWNYIKLDSYMDTLTWDNLYNGIRGECRKTLDLHLPFKPITRVFEII